MRPNRSPDRLQETVRQVSELLERHHVLEDLTHRQQTTKRDLLESLVHRQNLAELANHTRNLHPADLAFVLESLPPAERAIVWSTLPPRRGAEVLVEVSHVARESLLAATARPALLAMLREMDPEDLAYVAVSVAPEVLAAVYAALDADGLSRVRSSSAYAEGSVGQLMSQGLVRLREGQSAGEALAQLRALGELPRQTDTVYVVDARNVFKGGVPLQSLVVCDPASHLDDLLRAEIVTFAPDDAADAAAKAFERYDLVSAAVVDDRGKLIGRIMVDAVMDFVQRRSEVDALKRAGLAGEEDMFAPAWVSARNRWLWLAVNVVTAFVASRVIGVFEHTIERLVALATLMPIVASVGGNTGNQTVALVIRALALDRLSALNARHLVLKELTVSLLNGLLWGGVLGLLALALYRSAALGLVMGAAVVLNLLVAALVGVAVPFLLHRQGRDPAQGSSVLLTFTTDSMGFFLFLGLARAFLI